MSIERSTGGIRIRIVLLFCLMAAALAFGTSTQAQYFGRNKVQYETFDFKILETPHFRVFYYPEMREAAVDAGRMAEVWYDRFSLLFRHDLKEGQPVILYANHADFQQTNVISGLISPGVGGVTEGLRNRVVLPLTGIYAENHHVLGHELIHAFQYSIIKEGASGLSAARGMPLWFVEGMSEYLTLGRVSPLTAMWMRDAVLHDNVPTIGDMTGNPEYFPYRWGHAFWAWAAGHYGADVVPDLLYATVRSDLSTAMTEVLGGSTDSISNEWQRAIREKFGPQVAGRTAPMDLGEPVLKEDEAAMTLSPAVSPNGRHVAFIGRRDIFTLDLFLASLETGEIIRKLASSNSDAHFDALQFTSGSGAWSPDGSQFAFIVFQDGDNEITIVDVESGDVRRTLELPEVDAIGQIAWSPDGSTILLSGSSGGISDLYLYDLDTDAMVPLTQDRYAQIHPSWSPNGRMIAYSTDQGRAVLDRLSFAPMQVALMDVNTREVRYLSISEEAKHIDPQFGPNGDLYFVANPDGFNDVYRYSVDEDQVYRLTEIATGVTGLTDNSPVLSVADQSGIVLFTVFDEAGYNLRFLPAGELRGKPYQPDPGDYLAGAALPPSEATTVVSAYLDEATNGAEYGGLYEARNGDAEALVTADASRFETKDYDPSLGLTYIGQTAVGVGFDRFGANIGGGASFLFTDMLGNRSLGITAYASGRLKDIGAQAFYQNRRHRVNWGVGGGHVPYVSAFLQFRDTTTAGGDQRLVQEVIREYTFFDRVDLLAEYPISTNRRWEFTGGFSHVWYDLEADGIVIDNGFIVDEFERDIAAPSPLNIGHASVAYVGDYSLFGFTSPVKGTRYRVEVEPSFGTLTWLTALADVRQYFYLSPVTLAFRGLHIGRYLEDADSDRLSDLFLGYQTLVRGYDAYSLEPNECTTGDCIVYDRLLGSRLAVINAEIRLPLFGTDEFGLVDFTYLPTELALFLDGGVAWTGDDPPVWKLTEDSDERIPVFSAGIAARVNILGYIVGQFYLAWPFQRPEQTTEFGFVIAPGW